MLLRFLLRRARTAFRACPAGLLLGMASLPAAAGSYLMHSTAADVVGEIVEVASRPGDTLVDIARRAGMGYGEMRAANPGIDAWLLPEGSAIRIPGRFVLPDAPRRGVVLNLAEKRLYYFPPQFDGQPLIVFSFPVSIGREEWPTPAGLTRVASKVVRPTWFPPRSVRAEHAAQGQPLPPRVPPGPDNPLGEYALGLDLPGYLIHGTNKPFSIGMRVSHGCVRLYPEDIATLYGAIDVGTEVNIVDQPIKIGVDAGVLWIEVHRRDDGGVDIDMLRALVNEAVAGHEQRLGLINWDRIDAALERADGVPVAVSEPTQPLPAGTITASN